MKMSAFLRSELQIFIRINVNYLNEKKTLKLYSWAVTWVISYLTIKYLCEFQSNQTDLTYTVLRMKYMSIASFLINDQYLFS